MMNTIETFKIKGNIIVITGGAGLLGKKHAEAVLDGGGIPVLLDISLDALEEAQRELVGMASERHIESFQVDITDRKALEQVCKTLYERYGHIDGLVNNAANNPKVEGDAINMHCRSFEDFPLEIWNADILVGLTGALLCAQVFGSVMAAQGKGSIVNISSDLGIIAPDQRIYGGSIKPVAYSIVKHGIIGLSKYIATYWVKKGVRSNALCPGGIYNGQDEVFLNNLTNLIPMGRMADEDEYKGVVLYLLSDASSFMTGSTVIVDGGRTCW
jgi:NAD(P)-dependent dehydrogenase (short-subunit alcohol dehydrogenase family)